MFNVVFRGLSQGDSGNGVHQLHAPAERRLGVESAV